MEDNRADLYLIREAIEAAVDAQLHIVQDGDLAVRYLAEIDANEELAPPDIVLLDINLPKRNGAEVLQELRKSRRCGGTPVLVVTSSNSDPDRVKMKSLGADEYFGKPSVYEEYMKLGIIVQRLLGR